MSSEWEALPPRRGRRRKDCHAQAQSDVSLIGGAEQTAPTGVNDTDKASGSVPGLTGSDGQPAEQDGGSREGLRSCSPGRAAGSCGHDGMRESKRDDRMPAENRGAEIAPESHPAVANAVEARSRISRFSGGLEGGAGVDGANFEYLDHTADVQLHSWGDSLERAIEGALAAMFNVITDIKEVAVDPSLTKEIEAKGHDAMSLLFAVMDEFLFLFHAEGFAISKATVLGVVDRSEWKLRARAQGETFDLSKHPQGTEVKAITYSNMQINEDASGRTDIYVIVDI